MSFVPCVVILVLIVWKGDTVGRTKNDGASQFLAPSSGGKKHNYFFANCSPRCTSGAVVIRTFFFMLGARVFLQVLAKKNN